MLQICEALDCLQRMFRFIENESNKLGIDIEEKMS